MGQLQDSLPGPTSRAGTKAASVGPRRVPMCTFKRSANSQREKTSLIIRQKHWRIAELKQERRSPQTPDAEGTSFP